MSLGICRIARWLVLGLSLVQVIPAALAGKAGEATRVVRFAYQTSAPDAEDARRQPLYRFGDVLESALLETVPSGALQVTFGDRSVLTLGGNSRLRVDRFVFNGGDSGEQTIALAKGLFRFVSGSIPKNAVRLTTPSVSIGIRGTIFKLSVAEDASGTVYFEHGEGFVENREGRHVAVRQGERVEFTSNGDIGTPVKAAFNAGDHAVDQGLQAFGVIFGGPGAGTGGSAGVGTAAPADSTTSP